MEYMQYFYGKNNKQVKHVIFGGVKSQYEIILSLQLDKFILIGLGIVKWKNV